MSTSLFVLLWSSGAIFSKWGLAHASPFAFLLIRFVIALCGLLLLTPLLKLKLPKGGKPMLFAMQRAWCCWGRIRFSICWRWTPKSRRG
jgi:drug/metabolite transporter (DMT)-like permease